MPLPSGSLCLDANDACLLFPFPPSKREQAASRRCGGGGTNGNQRRGRRSRCSGDASAGRSDVGRRQEGNATQTVTHLFHCVRGVQMSYLAPHSCNASTRGAWALHLGCGYLTNGAGETPSYEVFARALPPLFDQPRICGGAISLPCQQRFFLRNTGVVLDLLPTRALPIRHPSSNRSPRARCSRLFTRLSLILSCFQLC